MHLPTASGHAVLDAFVSAFHRVFTTIPENEREKKLEQTLVDLVKVRWDTDCRRLWCAVAPSVAYPLNGVDCQNFEKMSTWYKETYDHQAARDKAIAESNGYRFPGHEFRAGRAEDGSSLYPTDPTTQTTTNKKNRSKRFGCSTEVRPGEHFPHPGDTESMWPGVSASHFVKRAPPTLTGGEDMPGNNFRWIPLARRVDLDRVLKTLRDHPEIFQDVTTTGEHGRIYKADAWAHMNPYHIKTSIQLKKDAGSQTELPHGEDKLNG